MSVAPRLSLAPDAFLEWEARQDERHEYHHGEVFAMAGGTEAHADLITNLVLLLSGMARPRGCKVFTEALRVRVEAADLFTYPDLSVVCGEPRFYDARRTTLLNPLVLVEVLSPSTETYDRTTKWGFYSQIPGLQAYVLVGQDGPGVDVLTRDGDAWRLVRTTTGEALIPPLGGGLALDALYDGVRFPGPDERLRPAPGA